MNLSTQLQTILAFAGAFGHVRVMAVLIEGST